jgi:uncharacterized membrane protein
MPNAALFATIGLLAGIALAAFFVFRKRPLPLNLAQREYVTVVLPKLIALYGSAEDYSPARVDRALRETRADTTHRAHAYALFCTSAAFSALPTCANLDYHHLRADMLLLRAQFAEIPWAASPVPFNPEHGS